MIMDEFGPSCLLDCHPADVPAALDGFADLPRAQHLARSIDKGLRAKNPGQQVQLSPAIPASRLRGRRAEDGPAECLRLVCACVVRSCDFMHPSTLAVPILERCQHGTQLCLCPLALRWQACACDCNGAPSLQLPTVTRHAACRRS
jgi:hypothetical protein